MKKQPNLLQAGDIVTRAPGFEEPRVLILGATWSRRPTHTICVWGVDLNEHSGPRPPSPTEYVFDMAWPVEIDAPDGVDLSLLIGAARHLLSIPDAPGLDVFTRATLVQLLDRLEPAPVAPTVAELTKALDLVDPDHLPPSSRDVLDRARRSGVLS